MRRLVDRLFDSSRLRWVAEQPAAAAERSYDWSYHGQRTGQYDGSIIRVERLLVS
jgi:hypothetical protein